MKSLLFLILMVLLTSAGCLPTTSKLTVDFKKKANQLSTTAQVSSVQITNHQLIINGTGLADISQVRVDGNSINESFIIESKSASQIIANSIRSFSFDTSKVFNLIISDANASSNFQIDFSLCNATMGTVQFDCVTTPDDNDVLVFDQGVWTPKPISAIGSLVYKGVWDATTAPTFPSATAAGQYYIITNESLPTYPLNDWIVWNGASYDVVHQSAVSGVASFKGRTGAVVPLAGDYDLAKMTDVDFTVAPSPGQVLKYIGGKWVAAADDTGTVIGAGSITTTELANASVTDAKIVSMATSKLTGTITSAQITDGTIVNADINAAAAIDYSKLNIANGEIPAAKISGLPVLSSILAATITDGDTTHSPDANVVFDTFATKLDKTGGTISLSLNVPTPVLNTEATTKLYVDTADNLKANKAGDTFSGVLTLDNDLLIKGGSNYVTVKGNAASTAYTLTLPIDAGTSNQVLTTNGSGVLSWTTPSGGGGAPTGAAGGDLSGTYPNPTISGLSAAKVGGGAVDNTEYSYLNGVTSAIQTQLDGKEASLPTGGTSLQYFAGDKTLQTLNTAAVPESGANYYFTDTRVRAATLTGLSGGSGTLVAGDTVLGAFGKLLTTQGDYVSKSGNSTVLGQITIDPTTGVLNVPTPASATQATNKAWVENLVDTYGHWIKTASDIYFSTGKVGIGTTAPNSKLHVVGGDIEVGSTFEGNKAIKLHTFDTDLSNRIWKMATNSTGVGVNNLVFSNDANGPGTMTDVMTILSTGEVGIGTSAPQVKVDVNGTIVSRPPSPYAGASVNLNTSNTHVLTSVGQSAITLSNMVHGGSYTLIIQDTTSRTYTFTGCNTSKFQPANMPTIASTHTMYNIMTIYNGASYDCYISWSSGYN